MYTVYHLCLFQVIIYMTNAKNQTVYLYFQFINKLLQQIIVQISIIKSNSKSINLTIVQNQNILQIQEQRQLISFSFLYHFNSIYQHFSQFNNFSLEQQTHQQMQIQSVMMRSQITTLQKQNAFLKIKIQMLESKQKPSDITLVNKELYLNYMEEVLGHKEKQLIQLEGQLQNKNLQLFSKEAQTKLLSPLQKSTQIDIFLKKIQQVKKVVVSVSDSSRGSLYGTNNQSFGFQVQQWKMYMKNEQKIIDQCRNYQRQTQNLIKNQYQNLIRQRKQFSQSMDKFEELNAYEKYLSQLQKILQIKERQVLSKEDNFERMIQESLSQSQNKEPITISFRNQQINVKEASQKKRAKIFQSAKPTQHKKVLPKYESVNSQSQSNSGNSHSSKPLFASSQYHSRDQSSFIMQQDDNDSQTLKKGPAIPIYQTVKEDTMMKKVEMQDMETQTNIQILSQSIQRLNNQKKLCKFLNLWMKHSINSKKTSSAMSKRTMSLYLWRLNTIYDQQIPIKVQKFNSLIDSKYQQNLRSQQLFPYSQLSLNRKKYAQITLDYQKKLYHRKRIQLSLKNIIKNKSFKQRVIFMCYFKKFSQNCRLKMVTDYYHSLSNYQKTDLKDQTHTALTGNSRCHTQSRLISVTSSRIMNENKGTNQIRQLSKQKSSKKSFPNKSLSNTNLMISNINKNQSRNIKQNISPTVLSTKNQNIDSKKLKQYIKQHEQAQKRLAEQCIKTQSVCKLGQILAPIVNRCLISTFYEMKMNEQNERVIQLQKRINKYEFKWQLFMTKCKLALVNNNNKMSYLQESLGFMFGK